MQETAYEPLILNVPLLAGSNEGTSRSPETMIDTDVAVEDDQPPTSEAQKSTTEEHLPLKKRRTIRFAE